MGEFTKKGIALVLGVAVVLAFTWVAANWAHLSSFTSIVSSYSAKEACSCLFVVGRDQETCTNYVRNDTVDYDSFEVDMDAKRVTVAGLGVTTSASYTNERYGCVID